MELHKECTNNKVQVQTEYVKAQGMEIELCNKGSQ